MTMTALPADARLSADPSSGGRLVTSDGRALPLRHVHLAAQAGGGIARVTLTQSFFNPDSEPLEVKYLLPLPSDGAVSGFSFLLDDRRVVGEVTGRQEARERFERAIVQGRTAALLEQDRSSLFTQRVGNVPPNCEIVAEIVIDQPLRWLEEGCWEWRFPTVVGARYQGAPGRVADAAQLNVPVAEQGTSTRASLTLDVFDRRTGPVLSPSHTLTQSGESEQEKARIQLEGGSAHLDRDVVVRWPIALPDVSAAVLAARPNTAAHDGDAFALFTVAPPTGGGQAVPRDLTFLIDTSGSMGGRPLEQAAEVVAAMVGTLGVNDRIELIEFGSSPKRWKREPVLATAGNKEAAIAWVRALRSSGCTEMHRAVLEALNPLRPHSQRQVILVTDGYIGFEQEIVATLLEKLPDGARLHTVGVGSSVNRSLTEAAARAGRGTELIIGMDEDPATLVQRLLARTTAPLVTDLHLEGPGIVEIAPRQLPDLYAESPALLTARVAPQGGEVILRGQTADGPFEQRFTVPALQHGEGNPALAALFAREKVEDLEMAISAGGDPAEHERSIEDTGVAFQISTRLTSWVAVSEKVTVAAGRKPKQVEQPHEVPHGVSVEGLGLRGSSPVDGLQKLGEVDSRTASPYGFMTAGMPAPGAAPPPPPMPSARRAGGGAMFRSRSVEPEELQADYDDADDRLAFKDSGDDGLTLGDMLGAPVERDLDYAEGSGEELVSEAFELMDEAPDVSELSRQEGKKKGKRRPASKPAKTQLPAEPEPLPTYVPRDAEKEVRDERVKAGSPRSARRRTQPKGSLWLLILAVLAALVVLFLVLRGLGAL